jgi:hypothetical protein
VTSVRRLVRSVVQKARGLYLPFDVPLGAGLLPVPRAGRGGFVGVLPRPVAFPLVFLVPINHLLYLSDRLREESGDLEEVFEQEVEPR